MKTQFLTVILVSAILLTAGQVQAGFVDSNSITQNGIEYYLQTEKSVYNLGEDVLMLYRVTNLTDEDVTFNFNNLIQYHFTVKQNENLIWDTPKVQIPMGSLFTLQPGGYKEYSEVWNLLNNQGVDVTPGIYKITGSFDLISLSLQDKNRYVPVSVQIEIVPEPASILLFVTGSTVLFIRHRKKK